MTDKHTEYVNRLLGPLVLLLPKLYVIWLSNL